MAIGRDDELAAELQELTATDPGPESASRALSIMEEWMGRPNGAEQLTERAIERLVVDDETTRINLMTAIKLTCVYRELIPDS